MMMANSKVQVNYECVGGCPWQIFEKQNQYWSKRHKNWWNVNCAAEFKNKCNWITSDPPSDVLLYFCIWATNWEEEITPPPHIYGAPYKKPKNSRFCPTRSGFSILVAGHRRFWPEVWFLFIIPKPQCRTQIVCKVFWKFLRQAEFCGREYKLVAPRPQKMGFWGVNCWLSPWPDSMSW